MISAEIEKGKSQYFFFQVNLLVIKDLIISRYDMIILIDKSWSVNLADWLFSQAPKSREGIFLISKCC